MAPAALPVNDKREIFGWAMYDWAQPAFSTTVGTVFSGTYVASWPGMAKASSDGMARIAGIPIALDFFFPYCVSISV
jgi:UMF1 family MFS transporter